MSDDMVTIPRSALAALAVQAERGAALGSWIATTALMGHTRPGHTLEYVNDVEEWSAQAFVRDFVAWTSGRTKLAPGCVERLREWGLVEARNLLNDATSRLGLQPPAA